MEKSEGMLEFVWVIVDKDGVEVGRSEPFGIFDGGEYLARAF